MVASPLWVTERLRGGDSHASFRAEPFVAVRREWLCRERHGEGNGMARAERECPNSRTRLDKLLSELEKLRQFKIQTALNFFCGDRKLCETYRHSQRLIRVKA